MLVSANNREDFFLHKYTLKSASAVVTLTLIIMEGHMKINIDCGYAVIDECGLHIYHAQNFDVLISSSIAIPAKFRNGESFLSFSYPEKNGHS